MVVSFIDIESTSAQLLLSMKKAGCLGQGNLASSLDSMKTTEAIVGLSDGNF